VLQLRCSVCCSACCSVCGSVCCSVCCSVIQPSLFLVLTCATVIGSYSTCIPPVPVCVAMCVAVCIALSKKIGGKKFKYKIGQMKNSAF